MANPFFSGRIPQDLYNHVEQHCTETGESKTDVLIKALGTYLNHPVSRPTTAPAAFEERFTSLEEQVVSLRLALEQLTSKTTVINTDNKQLSLLDNKSDNADNTSTGIATLQEDFWMQDSQIPDNAHDNTDNVNRDEEKPISSATEHVPAKFENLTAAELTKQTGLKQSQLESYKRRIAEKYQKMGQPLENKKLLEIPEKVEPLNPIVINGYQYDIFYLGQNEKGKGTNLWSVIPSDN